MEDRVTGGEDGKGVKDLSFQRSITSVDTEVTRNCAESRVEGI